MESLTTGPELENSQGHSRPGRASSKPGHVRRALKAEVFQSICDNSTGYCRLMALPGPRLSQRRACRAPLSEI